MQSTFKSFEPTKKKRKKKLNKFRPYFFQSAAATMYIGVYENQFGSSVWLCVSSVTKCKLDNKQHSSRVLSSRLLLHEN